jgi:DNA-binding NarL/FixJ family response regulator
MTIVVLEDTKPRIEWLEAVTGDYVWAEDVNTFFGELDKRSGADVRLIILDHDLGGFDPQLLTFPRDRNGMTGMDAVDQLPERWRHVPIIVWSINGPRAKEMVHRLRDRGFAAEHVPFSNEPFGRLRRAIRGVLEGRRVSPPKLSEEARAARAPRPPEELVGALQDRIHPTSGRLRAAKSVRFRGGR